MDPEAHCIPSHCCEHGAAALTADRALRGLCLPAGSGWDNANYICCLGDALTPCCLLRVCSFWMVFLKLQSLSLNRRLSSVQRQSETVSNFPSPTDVSSSRNFSSQTLHTYPPNHLLTSLSIPRDYADPYIHHFADIKRGWNFAQLHVMKSLLLFLPQCCLLTPNNLENYCSPLKRRRGS